ncbi:MAG: hypothetical protein BWK80_42975, partial [Desulfobacteraceae bacterium IS3]
DIDNDGKLSTKDALLIIRIVLGQPCDEVTVCGDVNGDGKLGIEEFVYILPRASNRCFTNYNYKCSGR